MNNIFLKSIDSNYIIQQCKFKTHGNSLTELVNANVETKSLGKYIRFFIIIISIRIIYIVMRRNIKEFVLL